MTVIPLSTDDDWDTEDYSLVDSELLPVKVFEHKGRLDNMFGTWFWRIDHPMMGDHASIGPFKTARDAYQNMMQYHVLSESPAEIPALLEGRIAMGALDATAEKLVMKMLESGDPAEQAKARELIEKYSYD